jgi:sugar lactone lactonase YvrE
MIARWRAKPASGEAYALGEGPVWDGPRERVLWVDILAGTVHEGRIEGDRVVRTRSRRFDRTVGAVVCGRTGELLVAGTESLLVVSADGEVSPGPRLLPAGSGRRLNDGACDPDGAFLVGSLDFDDRPGGEVLVRVGSDRHVTTLDEGLTLSNGLGWSPDGRLCYSIDTVPGVVYVREYRPLGPRRVLLEPDSAPDGMRVDADGNLWIAFWDAGEVRRYSPAGDLTGIVDVGVPHVSCPAFVGTGLDRLLITTATKDLTAAQLAAHPDAGRLFLADVGAVGLPATPWAGFD